VSGGTVYLDEQTAHMDERCWRRIPSGRVKLEGSTAWPWRYRYPESFPPLEVSAAIRDLGQSRLIGLLPKEAAAGVARPGSAV
jgi:hypothetical protein